MNQAIATLLVALTALVHLIFAAIELLAPQVLIRLVRLRLSTRTDVDETAKVVRNAGIYNAFIAAGLCWALGRWWGGLPGSSSPLELAAFFLGCVVVAGLVGTATLKSWVTLVFQTLLGALAFAAVWAWRR